MSKKSKMQEVFGYVDGRGTGMSGVVTAVSRSATHAMSKPNQDSIRLLAGLGVEGDAHRGENVTTQGIALLELPEGTLLHLGDTAVVAVTGLRNPCHQLNGIRPGLMAATLARDAAGNLVRKAGVMAIV